MDLSALIQSAGQQYNVDPSLIHAVIQTESSGNPNAVGPQTQYGQAEGLGQFIPATAKSLGISNPFDPAQAVPGIAKLLSENLNRYGDVQKAISAYHGGTDPANWGPKTQAYVQKVAANYGGAQMPTQQQPQDLPGLPPVNGPQQGMVDPFAKFRGDASQQAQVGVPANSQGMVDPFAKFRGSDSQTGVSVNSPPIPQFGGPQKSGAQIGSISGVDNQQIPTGAWQVPGSVTMGIGDVVRGGAHDIVHGLSWLANKIAPNSQFAKDAAAALPQMQQTIDAQNAAYDAQRAAQQPQTLTSVVTGQKPSLGTDWGRLAGNAIGTLPVMALGGGTGVAGRIGMGALQGAVSGGLMPTTGNSNQSFAQQKIAQMGIGGALGAAVPAAFEGARALGTGLWNAARPVFQPERYVGQGITGLMDPAEAAAAAANIRSAPQFVPGSNPTTAQVAGNPMLVQTEKAAGNIPAFKTAATERAIENNNARWQALMGVAGTDADLSAAQTARDAAASPLYQQAHQATANVGPAFMRYAQIPEMQQAMDAAQRNAALDAAVGRGVAPVWPTPTSNAINGSALDYTSRALGDMIGDAQRSGATSRAASLTALKDSVDNWTQRYIPGVQAAKAAYAQGSVPVNTMEAGQAIANGLGTRAMNAGGVPEIGLMPFRSALTSAMKNSPYGIDANALNTLQGIGQDLQRATVSNSIKSPGSDTAYNLAANGWLARNLYGPSFGGSGALGRSIAGGLAGLATTLAGHPLAGAGVAGTVAGGLGSIGKMVGGRLQDRLTGLLMDPNMLLPYLDARAAAASQAVPNPLMQGLLNYGRPAITNGLVGGLINAH